MMSVIVEDKLIDCMMSVIVEDKLMDSIHDECYCRR